MDAALLTAFTTIATDCTTNIAAVVPVGLVVFGSLTVIKVAKRAFGTVISSK